MANRNDKETSCLICMFVQLYSFHLIANRNINTSCICSNRAFCAFRDEGGGVSRWTRYNRGTPLYKRWMHNIILQLVARQMNCCIRKPRRDFRLPTTDLWPPTSDFGLRTSHFSLPTSDFGLQISNFRLSPLTAGCELQENGGTFHLQEHHIY